MTKIISNWTNVKRFIGKNIKQILYAFIGIVVLIITTLSLTIRKYVPTYVKTKTTSSENTKEVIENKSFFFSYPSLFKILNTQTQKEFEEDIKQVRHGEIYERTLSNIQFFKETDIDITKKFHELLPETNTFLGRLLVKAIIYNPLLMIITLFLKFAYNRARPFQIADIKPLHSTTSTFTPSYPSTHAVQAYALAKRLTIKYPEKAEKINELAEKIADIRRIGGVHFPSDKKFAKRVVNSISFI